MTALRFNRIKVGDVVWYKQFNVYARVVSTVSKAGCTGLVGVLIEQHGVTIDCDRHAIARLAGHK